MTAKIYLIVKPQTLQTAVYSYCLWYYLWHVSSRQHGLISDNLLLSATVPIPRNYNVDLTESVHYRDVISCTIFCELFDFIVLIYCIDRLTLSVMQYAIWV